MKFGLKDKVIKQVDGILAAYPQVKKAVLYGPRAKGNYKNGSDIDLTLVGDDLNLQLLHKIELDIDDLMFPYSFDISIFHHLSNPDLVEHIDRAGVVFYEAFKIIAEAK
ncbi:MAG: nucleotidyltransferase domain-containing protein [Desulfobacteraceae bacterium]|nr:nucleotidyltransferase domain-containing protein [Desulfobacteraceae bacterium]